MTFVHAVPRTQIVWPKHILLPYRVDIALGEWLKDHPSRSRGDQFAQLIEMGLKNSAAEETSKALTTVLVELHFLAQAAVALDEPPHPRPAHVDPKVWEHREAERLRRIGEHQARAVRDIEVLAGKAVGLVRGAEQ